MVQVIMTLFVTQHEDMIWKQHPQPNPWEGREGSSSAHWPVILAALMSSKDSGSKLSCLKSIP